jgi:hypothetical protein
MICDGRAHASTLVGLLQIQVVLLPSIVKFCVVLVLDILLLLCVDIGIINVDLLHPKLQKIQENPPKLQKNQEIPFTLILIFVQEKILIGESSKETIETSSKSPKSEAIVQIENISQQVVREVLTTQSKGGDGKET